MSRATEITTSRRGDVTNARDKQTVLCPLLISNYWTGGCCELKCAWFYCLLRSYKSSLQLFGLTEHVDVAFITNQKWVWLLSDCYVLWKVLVYWGTARGLPTALWVLYTMFPLYARILATLKFMEFTCQRNWEGWNTKTVFWIEMTEDWDAGLLWKGSGTVGSGPNNPPPPAPPCFLCTIWWLDNLRSIKKIMRDKIANFTASNVHYPQLACTLRNESEVKWFIKRKK